MVVLGQSNKVAELLLDVNVDLLLTGPQPSAKSTAVAIAKVRMLFLANNGLHGCCFLPILFDHIHNENILVLNSLEKSLKCMFLETCFKRVLSY